MSRNSDWPDPRIRAAVGAVQCACGDIIHICMICEVRITRTSFLREEVMAAPKLEVLSSLYHPYFRSQRTARLSRSSNKWIFNSRERRDPWRWHLLIYDFRLRVQNIYPHDHSRSPCTTLPTTPQIMFPGMGHPGTDLRYHTGISWASNMRRKKSTINIRHFVNSWKWSCQFWFTGSWATQQHHSPKPFQTHHLWPYSRCAVHHPRSSLGYYSSLELPV